MGQLAGQLGYLARVIGAMVCRELPNIKPPQIGDALIPQGAGVDDGGAGGGVLVNPFRCGHCRVFPRVDAGKGDGV